MITTKALIESYKYLFTKGNVNMASKAILKRDCNRYYIDRHTYLTGREMLVLSLLYKDLSAEEIATRIGISTSRAKNYIYEIKSKLSINKKTPKDKWLDDIKKMPIYNKVIKKYKGE